MLDQRKAQSASGRIILQTDEEYGYNDHNPRWSPHYPNGQSTDADRRAASEIAMASGLPELQARPPSAPLGAWPDHRDWVLLTRKE